MGSWLRPARYLGPTRTIDARVGLESFSTPGRLCVTHFDSEDVLGNLFILSTSFNTIGDHIADAVSSVSSYLLRSIRSEIMSPML